MKYRKIATIAGFVLVTLLVLLYIGLPAGFAAYTVLPGRSQVGTPPPGFQEVSLPAEDGVQLQGWYRPPENGVAVILLHGAGSSRESLRPYAEFLGDNGFGVLALDLRGHGESEGRTNRMGWQGTRDVGGAVAFLQGQPEVQAIGGLGISMGGEILLGAASEYPVIQAIAADGATRRSIAELLALESERPLVRNFTARVMFAALQLFSGETPPKPLLDSLVESGSTRFYLIAAGKDNQEVAFNQLFAMTLGERASLWVAPGAKHTGAYRQYPGEYEQRVFEFFQRELLGNP
jgi:pimeloyl-ACP methyl ester carboxylesterase